MTSSKTMIVLVAAAGSMCLAACETGYGPASTAARRDATDVNRACRPGNTPAGTRSGLTCDPGSSTGTPSGNDANVQGAGSAGSAPAVPH
jgi:hypothetical protein